MFEHWHSSTVMLSLKIHGHMPHSSYVLMAVFIIKHFSFLWDLIWKIKLLPICMFPISGTKLNSLYVLPETHW